MNSKKLRRVKITMPDGSVRYLTMKHVNKDISELICNECPYDKICDKIPHPLKPEDKSVSMVEFCGELEDNYEDQDMREELANMMPVDGAIENAFPEIGDLIKVIDERNPLVHIGDVIDAVCEDLCMSYKKDHSGCSSCNATCILKDIIKDKNVAIPVEDEQEEGEEEVVMEEK